VIKSEKKAVINELHFHHHRHKNRAFQMNGEAVARLRKLIYNVIRVQFNWQDASSCIEFIDSMVERLRNRVSETNISVVVYGQEPAPAPMDMALFLPSKSIVLRRAAVDLCGNDLVLGIRRTFETEAHSPGLCLLLCQLYDVFLAPIVSTLPTKFTAIIPQLWQVPPLSMAIVRQTGQFFYASHSIGFVRALEDLILSPGPLSVPRQTATFISPHYTTLPALPSAALEASVLSSYLAAYGYAIDRNPRTTPAEVQDALRHSDVIHIAAHGADSAGAQTGVYLSDREVFLPDSLTIALSASEASRLVILSHCQVSPEPRIGLADSLLVAGVPAVLATLWKIDDATVCYSVMPRLYTQLFRHGCSPADAIRATLLNQVTGTLPAVAAFVAYGAGAHDPIIRPPDRRSASGRALLVQQQPDAHDMECYLRLFKHRGRAIECQRPTDQVLSVESVLLGMEWLLATSGLEYYILAYAGLGARGLGSWVLNDKEETISLQIVVMVWCNSPAYRASTNSVLFLICDCTDSGAWAHCVREHPEWRIEVLAGAALSCESHTFSDSPGGPIVGVFTRWLVAYLEAMESCWDGQAPERFPLTTSGIPEPLMTVQLFRPQPNCPPQEPVLSRDTGSLLALSLALYQCRVYSHQ
jgi:hypothetical protein